MDIEAQLGNLKSALETASFDAIVSFEMLEHVQQPAAAFAEMARLVRPGGIVYHDYNPFFSSKGGHSLCTLAFQHPHTQFTRQARGSKGQLATHHHTSRAGLGDLDARGLAGLPFHAITQVLFGLLALLALALAARASSCWITASRPCCCTWAP